VDFAKVSITIPESIEVVRLVGVNDVLLRTVEDRFDASITLRGNRIDISGDAMEIQVLTAIFSDMIKMIESGEELSPELISRSIDLINNGEFPASILREDILLTYRGKAIRAKTAGQKRYVEAIRSNTISFCIGPAGTGKTYIAMAMAVAALKRKEINRIILTRPVVEAGESLGYLPGTLNEKIDPYIRPLYDALFDMTDMERGNQLIAQGVIEIAPLAFMRGRTLNDSFIILDEAQNTTPDQMKMFLTRLGFGSKMVITGDITQLDLPKRVSGLKSVRQILEGCEDIAFVDLSGKDVVRHHLVQRIVAAYDEADRQALEKKYGASDK
jgi:phosphate starvation-inducible PhoH-like protein